MIKGLWQRALKVASAFLLIEQGSILIYTGAFMAVGVGGAALSIDIGRIVLLRTQMQNRADAGALGGAAQLDAFDGAIARADSVVRDSMKAWTSAGADADELVVLTVTFYAAADDNISRGEITDDDNAARFVEVILERRTLSFFYAPASNLLDGGDANKFTELSARAVAMSDPFVCKAQPLMICNPFDDGDPLTDDPSPTDAEYAGFGIMLKASIQGDGTVTPGNFGMLALPSDDSFNGSGNSAIAVYEALAAEEPEVCFGLNTLTTAPGAMVVSVTKAINTRFGSPWWQDTPIPAPNIMNYYVDDVQLQDPDLVMGDGVWSLKWYWDHRHLDEFGDIVPMPAILAGATRYQLYLFEQGIVYWKKNGAKKTLVTALEDMNGWIEVDPADYPEAAVIPTSDVYPHNSNRDGIPEVYQTISSIGYERRVLRVAVMECKEYAIKGKDTYPAQGQFLAIFLIRKSSDVFEGGVIYGEIIGPVEPRISLEFHGNVRLVE